MSMRIYRGKDKDGTTVYESEVKLLEELSMRKQKESPDFLDLKQQDFHPVFVYGTLKSGNKFHDFVKGCPFLGRGTTLMDKYDLIEPEHRSYPVMREYQKASSADKNGRIKGEIYAVSPLTMLEMDRLESNGNMYTRKQIWVVLNDQTMKVSEGNKCPTIQAWCYIGHPLFWADQDVIRSSYSVDSKGKVYDWKEQKNNNHRIN